MQNGLREAGAVGESFRKCVYVLATNGFQGANFDSVIHGFVALGSIHAANFCSKPEESLNVHVRIGWCVLWKIANDGFGRLGLVYNTVITQDRVTAIGCNIARNHSHCGRFAGAIGAKKAKDFAFFDLKTKVINSHVGAEGFSEILDFDHTCLLTRFFYPALKRGGIYTIPIEGINPKNGHFQIGLQSA